ncbi:hypothetical protein EYF80_034068 [Liparis tanakae]|uniref:Uncharacterized protein n=1 Tax=Liparis tanakae TaxID=230148 RepID=A0A4Z2GSE9_9TELE|nr:hypothetical protein EYF80_034068 [Liparis tanakae]
MWRSTSSVTHDTFAVINDGLVALALRVARTATARDGSSVSARAQRQKHGCNMWRQDGALMNEVMGALHKQRWRLPGLVRPPV